MILGDPHSGPRREKYLETRVGWEQAESRARQPRPWRPDLGNQVPGKSTFCSAHQTPRPGEVEPEPPARAGKHAVSWSPRRAKFSGHRGAQAALAVAGEWGSGHGPGGKLAARYAALINPQSIHLIPGSKPEPGEEAGQRRQLCSGLSPGGGTQRTRRSREHESAFLPGRGRWSPVHLRAVGSSGTAALRGLG